ncbi:Synaptic vesicle glycoprotein 2B [Portunus trituberculatus]|uniref:Synaptic vesicle glycoprotein 2B n=1 Tax=Portunus trituberculatus TaxID=210409 RepID=A0A5B7I5N4_PORTR|nr:Synaptic vesicle glycoprotein 2B [Portunus trituberculatus]
MYFLHLVDHVCFSSTDINDDVDEGEEYEVAITATGYGSFQYWLILLGGFANASDAIEILCVSILLPAAECDLHMTSEDKGWLSAIAFVGEQFFFCREYSAGRNKLLSSGGGERKQL